MYFNIGDVQLERCIALIKANPAAARQMFRYASQRMSIDDTGILVGLLFLLTFYF